MVKVQPYAISNQQSAISNQLSAISYQRSAVSGQSFVLFGEQVPNSNQIVALLSITRYL